MAARHGVMTRAHARTEPRTTIPFIMLPFIISAATLGLTTPHVVLYRRPISVVQFTGADRKRFLHGLCTVDVNSLAGCAETAVVDAAGNALDLLTLVDGADEDSLLALGDGGRGAELAQFFDKYAYGNQNPFIEPLAAC